MKISDFLSENFMFLEVKFSIYLNRRVFVMSMKNKTILNVVCLHIKFTLPCLESPYFESSLICLHKSGSAFYPRTV